MNQHRFAYLFLLVFAFAGCPEHADDDDTVGDDDGGDDDSGGDADGDGYTEEEGDCDDTDASVHPGADEEWHDGEDSNCDGEDDPDPCDVPPPEWTVEADDECDFAPPPGAFNPITEWSMDTFSDYPDHRKTYMSPMVGQVTDDNGDGVVDELDIPDLAVVSRNAEDGSDHMAVLRLLSGDGSEVHWSVYEDTWDKWTVGPYRYSGVALGDIDNDGETEIAVAVVNHQSDFCFLAAYADDGSLEWVYTGLALICGNHMPAIHDLEGDGDVEVILGGLIINGEDGSLQGEGGGGQGYDPNYSNSGYHSFGIDLDGDGTMEVLSGSSVYGPDGTELCNIGGDDGYPAAADLDGDGVGEFVVTGAYEVRLFEADCTPIDSWALDDGGRGGPPTIADFDGDGDPEIAVASIYYYFVFEVDGTELWRMPVTDESSNSTGSSVFDFDGDGKAEVVYADETRLWVFDGATGAVLLESEDHSSGTKNEYPTIADVDGDGKAEIIVPNGGSPYYGLFVLGDADDRWVSARQLWNQAAYYITNVDDDLGIPSPGPVNWPEYNNFRQGAPGHFNPLAAANLYPEVYGPCQDAPGDPVDVLVQVANGGAIQVSGTIVTAVYGVDGGGARTLLDDAPIGVTLFPGVLAAAETFTFDPAALSDFEQLVVVVDDSGASAECDEDDNEAVLDLDGVSP